MAQIKAEFSGRVVAEPEAKTVGQSNLLQFPVYVNHSKKNRDTDQWEDTGDVSKIRVTLWREKADMADVRKGDIVAVVGTLIEKEWEKQDGSKGRSLQTDYVDSVELVKRFDNVDNAPVAPWDPPAGVVSIPSDWTEVTPEESADAPF